MSRREHVCKLPYGRRIDCETVTDRDAGTITLTALAYEGSDRIGYEHVAVATRDSIRTCGDLIDWRNHWLAGIAEEVCA